LLGSGAGGCLQSASFSFSPVSMFVLLPRSTISSGRGRDLERSVTKMVKPNASGARRTIRGVADISDWQFDAGARALK
jgi:hypothetical protein